MRGVTRVELVLIGVLLVANFVSIRPLLQDVLDTSDDSQLNCAHELKVIALALHNYHDEHGSFPPARTIGADGATHHSWRVLLLPHLGERPLYDQYRFEEPWDGENNRLLHHELPSDYPFHVCPLGDLEAASKGRTSYLAVVGPHTAWRGETAVSFDEVTDGIDQTILLVEVANSDVNWFEPRDLQWDEMSFRINDPDSLSPGSPHVQQYLVHADTPYVTVVMVDGHVKKLPVDTPPETLRALLTIDGGESFDDPFLP